jgi:hypothetical protein
MCLVFVQVEVVETRPTFGIPINKFVNVVYGKQVGVVFLENPLGTGMISKSQLLEEVLTVFGLDPHQKRALYLDARSTQEISENLIALCGKIVYLSHETSQVTVSGVEGSSFCRFVELEHSGKKATLLLENPAGCEVTQYAVQVKFRLNNPSGLKH